jgi:hypothetical protein
MQIRTIGLTACLLGMTYTASAGYTWSEFQGDEAKSAQGASAATHGYTWSTVRDSAPAAATHGYSWSTVRDAEPAAATHGYTWTK